MLTCHRSELYVDADNPEQVRNGLRHFFTTPSFKAIVADSATTLRPETPLRILQDADTVVHFLRVASGLDSVVVGEHEILGQVRRAYQNASAQRALTPQLRKLLDTALRHGRFVRNVDGYRVPRRSYAREAIRLLEESSGPLRGRAVGVVGAGNLAAAAARALRSRGVGDLLVFNRGMDSARKLAKTVAAKARPLTRLQESLPDLAGLVVAVRSPRPVLDLHGSSVSVPPVVDLSTPTVIAGGDRVWRLDQILERLAKTSGPSPRAIRRVEALTRDAADHFLDDAIRHRQPHEDVLRRLNSEAENLSTREVEVALARLRHLSPDDQETVRELARSLRTKLLMSPTLVLRTAGPHERAAIAKATARLFGLPAPAKNGRATR